MIRVKHAPSAAAIGESAYTIGRGEKMRWATDVALKQQALGLQARGLEARAAALEQEEKERERLHGLREAELEFRKEQHQDELGLKLQRRLDEQKRLEIENTIYEYSPVQIKDLDRLNACEAKLEKEYAEGKWNLEGLQEGMLQIKQKREKIIPQARIRTEMTAGERLKSRFAFDATGARYLEDANGNWKRQGLDEEGYLKMAVAAAKVFTTQDMRTTIKDKSGKEIVNKDFGMETVDWEKTYAFIDDMRARFARAEGFAVIAEEEQKRQAEQPQTPIEPNVNMQNVIESRQKAIDRVKGILQQEDYASMSEKEKLDAGVNMLKRYGIKVSPDELKAGPELKQAPTGQAPGLKKQEAIDYVKNILQHGQYAALDEKTRLAAGVKMLSNAGYEMTPKELKAELETEPQSQEEFIRTIQSMDDKAKAKAYYDKWVGKWQ